MLTRYVYLDGEPVPEVVAFTRLRDQGLDGRLAGILLRSAVFAGEGKWEESTYKKGSGKEGQPCLRHSVSGKTKKPPPEKIEAEAGNVPAAPTPASPASVPAMAPTIRGRTPTPGASPRSFVRDGRNAARIGEVFQASSGQRYVVTRARSNYVSSDRIDDNDDWHVYKAGPGHYTHFDASPVDPTAAERRADAELAQKKADDEAAKVAAAEAARRKKASVDAALPARTETAPPDDVAKTLAWEKTPDDHPWKGGVGEIATLPDGRQIGRSTHSGYDDHRAYYHVPQDVADSWQIRSAIQHGTSVEDARSFLSKYKGCSGTDRMEAILRASPHDQALIEASTARKRVFDADKAKEGELYKRLATTPHDSPDYDRIEGERRELSARHAGSPYGTIYGFNSSRAVARRTAFDAALKAHGVHEGGSENTPEEKASISRLKNRYGETADPAALAEASTLAAGIKARRAPEPEEDEGEEESRHEVRGDTYQHKDRIKAIGGRWDAANRRWIIPADVSHRLPRGLSSRPI